MMTRDVEQLMSFDLKSVALSRFDQDREYPNVISPFTRMYLITEGKGWIVVENEKIILEPNYLYLIPSYTPCSYFFSRNLNHYYIHFSTTLLNGLKIYNLYNTDRKIASNKLDALLFARLLEINPDLELPHPDPDIYQTKLWLNKKNHFRTASHCIESRGILEQLLSRFIRQEREIMDHELLRYNVQKILQYIQDHLKETISINTLAQMACLSNDHFTRIFKAITSMPPCEFIIQKRVEKAQLLMLTTDLPLKRIIEETGFKSMAYFSRTFKKYTALSPSNYRKQRSV
jgi:AraC-like DNA-binding protein